MFFKKKEATRDIAKAITDKSSLYEVKTIEKMALEWKVFSKIMLFVSSLTVGITAMFGMINNIEAIQNAVFSLGMDFTLDIKNMLAIAIVSGIVGGYLLERATINLLKSFKDDYDKYNSRTNISQEGKHLSYILSFIGVAIFMYANAWLFVESAKNIVTLTSVPKVLIDRENTYKALAHDEKTYIDKVREKLQKVENLSPVDVADAVKKEKAKKVEALTKKFEPIIKEKTQAFNQEKAKLDAWKKREMKKTSNKKDGFKYLNKVYKTKLYALKEQFSLDELKDKFNEELSLLTVNKTTDEIISEKKKSLYEEIEEHRTKMLDAQKKLEELKSEIKSRVNGVFSPEAYWFVALFYILAQLVLEVKTAGLLEKREMTIADAKRRTLGSTTPTQDIKSDLEELNNIISGFDNFIEKEEKPKKKKKNKDTKEGLNQFIQDEVA